MRRVQLIEIEDLPWCPAVVRDGGTDWLAFMFNATHGYAAAAAPFIRAAMTAVGTTHVLDLCSGGGGPWPTLYPELLKSGPVSVVLSDLYPNRQASPSGMSPALRVQPTAVDATNVPADLGGVRTMFNAFHHFDPPTARAILGDAVAKRRAIAIFEGVHHRGLGLFVPLQVPAMLLLTPWVRPFRWSRLFFTYLVPLIPALVVFDGIASFLRLYLEPDLRELVAGVPGRESYDWDIGTAAVPGTPVRVTYLVGTPQR
jgi:hypothetical protein